MSHLAAALGVRTVALFGPTNARQWAPRGEKVTVVRRDIACSPCLEPTMKSCHHRACLRELHSSEIIDVLAALPEMVTLTRYRAKIRV
jgi:heptosyltransferase-2